MKVAQDKLEMIKPEEVNLEENEVVCFWEILTSSRHIAYVIMENGTKCFKCFFQFS